jgi:hypothetical protein
METKNIDYKNIIAHNFHRRNNICRKDSKISLQQNNIGFTAALWC